MSLKEFREAKGFDDYYKSTFNLIPEEGENERLADGLEDAIGLFEMEKGDRKDIDTLHVSCVEKIVKKKDGTDEFEGEMLIMLTYDAYPDDTIKLRYEVGGDVLDDGSFDCGDYVRLYYFDSEEQENPTDYSGFEELLSAVEKVANA